MLTLHRRIEKLERASGLSDRLPSLEFTIEFVQPAGEVTSTLLLGPDGRREWIGGRVLAENRKEAE